MSVVVGLEVNEKEIHYIFVHYLNGLYNTLNRHYRCPKKVRQLIDLGDIRELKFNIDYTSKYCCGYDYKIYGDSSELFLRASGYNKILFKNGTWYVCEDARKGPKLLSEHLRKD
jgi:hypothetical protein